MLNFYSHRKWELGEYGLPEWRVVNSDFSSKMGEMSINKGPL
jgi:hypothetical protein